MIIKHLTFISSVEHNVEERGPSVREISPWNELFRNL